MNCCNTWRQLQDRWQIARNPQLEACATDGHAEDTGSRTCAGQSETRPCCNDKELQVYIYRSLERKTSPEHRLISPPACAMGGRVQWRTDRQDGLSPPFMRRLARRSPSFTTRKPIEHSFTRELHYYSKTNKTDVRWGRRTTWSSPASRPRDLHTSEIIAGQLHAQGSNVDTSVRSDVRWREFILRKGGLFRLYAGFSQRRKTDWPDGGNCAYYPTSGRKSRAFWWAVCREMRGRVPNQCRWPKDHAAAQRTCVSARPCSSARLWRLAQEGQLQPESVPPCGSEQVEECSKVARGCDKSDIDILSSVGGSGDSSRRALQAFSHGEGNQLGVWRAQPAADFHRDAPLCWSFEVRAAPAANALSAAAVQPVRMRDWRS
ncbi:hypothetical protein HBI72_155800 [Parastagonospora nodorum]|nr:hypothetical protein HBI76_156960 [Parastagonospora nodorum]KAH5250031.1 hypothetical protein HBI72_155800 [Parastagonospora nodorum]